MCATSVEYGHRILSAALKHAAKMEMLYRNPAQVVDPPRVDKREVQPPTVDTINRILDSSDQDFDRLFPALRLITYSGIRRGECLGLHWQLSGLHQAGDIRRTVAGQVGGQRVSDGTAEVSSFPQGYRPGHWHDGITT